MVCEKALEEGGFSGAGGPGDDYGAVLLRCWVGKGLSEKVMDTVYGSWFERYLLEPLQRGGLGK